MISPFYINSAACISAQETLNEGNTIDFQILGTKAFVNAIDPLYKDYIPPAQIRRMSKSVKMSIVAAQFALQKAGIENPDVIIVGTGAGCLIDSEKFLTNIIEQEEAFLTPTHFIQSTHNTVAGQIALGLSCHGYNFTYVNPSSSLAFSLLDAGMHLTENPNKHILVGAADEIANRSIALHQLNNTIINESALPTNILTQKNKGVVWSEGASFFVAAASKTDNTLAQVMGVDICNTLSIAQLSNHILSFLQQCNMQLDHIDAVLLGYNGSEEHDVYYDTMREILPNAQPLYWKHLSGEFNTSNGFAVFMACQILKNKAVPEIMKVDIDRTMTAPRNILIYNQFHGKEHSFILLAQS